MARRKPADYEPDQRAAVAPLTTCKICKYAREIQAALVCYRNPPSVAVIEGRAQTMRVAINPGDFACGEYRAR
jgi:hypothetical protein